MEEHAKRGVFWMTLGIIRVFHGIDGGEGNGHNVIVETHSQQMEVMNAIALFS